MKVFEVSNACNACGECLLATNLLTETAEGFATPAPGRYIEVNELAQAENLVRQCPVGALSIVDHSSTSAKGREGLKQLATILENRMKAVQIPNVSYKDVEFKESDYHVEHQWVDEYKIKYPSFDKAYHAAKEEFKKVYLNHMKDFITSILMQYKSKVLRKYYDLSDPKHTYYAQIGAQMTAILEEVQAEAQSMTGSTLCFPVNFTQFNPEMNSDFTKALKDYYDNYAVSLNHIKSISEGLLSYDSKQSIDNKFADVSAEESGSMEVKSLFGKTSWKTAYRMADVNNAGKRLIEIIFAALQYPSSYDITYSSIEDMQERELKRIIDMYKELVAQEITQKVGILKKLIE